MPRTFDKTYDDAYRQQMRRKLGIRFAESSNDREDDLLVADLLEIMQNTGADFTNTFRALR